jgi:rod shape-determining protein MreD
VTSTTVLRTVLVLVVGLLLQTTVVLNLRIADAHPDIMLLFPIAAALVGGPVEGTVMGFLAGMASDLVLPTPFGLSALVGCLLGFGVGLVVRGREYAGPWLPPLAALTGSAGAVMLYAVLGAVLGQDQFLKANLAAIVGVVAVTNAVLALPAVAPMRWVLAPRAGSTRAAAGGRR